MAVTAPIVTNNGFITVNQRFEIRKPDGTFVAFDPRSSMLDISYNGSTLRYAADYINDITKTIYSSEVPVQVKKAAPALIVEASPNSPATYGNEVVLSATLSGAYMPGGTIQFKVNGVNLGDPVTISEEKAVYRYTPNANDTPY